MLSDRVEGVTMYHKYLSLTPPVAFNQISIYERTLKESYAKSLQCLTIFRPSQV